jgi:hypothetical protein
VKFQEEKFDQKNQKTGEVKKLKRQRVIFKCHCGKISDALKQYCVTGKEDSITGCRECSVRQNDPKTIEKVKNVLENANCEFISATKGRNIQYKCHCGNISNTHSHNLINNGREKKFRGCNKCYNIYNFTYLSGREAQGYGYEPEAFLYLAKKLGSDEYIEEGWNYPTIKYVAPKTTRRNKGKREYTPDGFIKSTNTIIEVKSPFTYKLHKELNDAKFKACCDQGYNIIILFFIEENGCKRHVIGERANLIKEVEFEKYTETIEIEF